LPLEFINTHRYIQLEFIFGFLGNQGVVAEQQDQDIPLEGLVVEEPQPAATYLRTGTETETIARTNSQADNSYLAPPTPSQVQGQIS